MLLLPTSTFRAARLSPEERIWQLLGSFSLSPTTLTDSNGNLRPWVVKSALRDCVAVPSSTKTKSLSPSGPQAAKSAAKRAATRDATRVLCGGDCRSRRSESPVHRTRNLQAAFKKMVESVSDGKLPADEAGVLAKGFADLIMNVDAETVNSLLLSSSDGACTGRCPPTSRAFLGLSPVYGVPNDDRDCRRVAANFDLEVLMTSLPSAAPISTLKRLAAHELYHILLNSIRGAANLEALCARSSIVRDAFLSPASVASVVNQNVLLQFKSGRQDLADLCLLCEETGKMIYCVLEHFSSLEARCELQDFTDFCVQTAQTFEALHGIHIITPFVRSQLVHYSRLRDFQRGARHSMLLSNVFWMDDDFWFAEGLEMKGLYQSPYMMKALWPALMWLVENNVKGPWNDPSKGFYPHINFDLEYNPLDFPADIFPPFVTFLRCMHTVYQMRRRGDDVEIEDDDEPQVSSASDTTANLSDFVRVVRGTTRTVETKALNANEVLKTFTDLLLLEEEVDAASAAPFRFPESLVTCFPDRPTVHEKLLADFLRFMFWELRSGKVDVKELNVCSCQPCREQRFQMFSELKSGLVLYENGRVDIPLSMTLKNMTVLVKEVMWEHGVKNEEELQAMLLQRAQQNKGPLPVPPEAPDAGPRVKKKRPMTKVRGRRR